MSCTHEKWKFVCRGCGEEISKDMIDTHYEKMYDGLIKILRESLTGKSS